MSKKKKFIQFSTKNYFIIKNKQNRIKNIRPQASAVFGLHPPSQLVIGYHWLAFLSQVRKCSKNFWYKIDHISHTKNRKNYFFIVFRTLRIFLDQKPNLATFKTGGGEEGGLHVVE